MYIMYNLDTKFHTNDWHVHQRHSHVFLSLITSWTINIIHKLHYSLNLLLTFVQSYIKFKIVIKMTHPSHSRFIINNDTCVHGQYYVTEDSTLSLPFYNHYIYTRFSHLFTSFNDWTSKINLKYSVQLKTPNVKRQTDRNVQTFDSFCNILFVKSNRRI